MDFDLRATQIIVLPPTQASEQLNETQQSKSEDKEITQIVVNLKLFVLHENLEAIVGRQIREIKKGNRNWNQITETVSKVTDAITSTLDWFKNEYPEELTMMTMLSLQGWTNIASIINEAQFRPLQNKDFESISGNKKFLTDQILENKIPDFKLNSRL